MRADDRQLAAIATTAPKEATSMQDQIIDTVMAALSSVWNSYEEILGACGGW